MKSLFQKLALCLAIAIALALPSQVGAEATGSMTERLPLAGFPERPYDLYVPPGLSGPAPVLLVLHGGGGDAAGMRGRACPRAGGDDFGHPGCFLAHARASGYVVVFPRGTARAPTGTLRSWNAGGAPGTGWLCMDGPACRQDVDERAYFSALLDDLPTHAGIDPARIYVTGFSSGAAMGLRLACEMSDRVAAVAAISGTAQALGHPGCRPARPVPVLQVHGTADCNWPYEGGAHRCNGGWPELQGGAGLVSVAETLAFWAQANGCEAGPKEVPMRDRLKDGTYLVRYDWQGCAAALRHIRIEGGGHQWPGGHAVDWPGFLGRASRETGLPDIWEFLSGFRLDEPAAGG